MKVNSLKNNCCGEVSYFFIDGDNVCIVDPGDRPTDLMKTIVSKLKSNDPKFTIILTHGHYDHIAGVNSLCETLNVVNIYVCSKEENFLYTPSFNLSCHFGGDYVISDQNKQLIKFVNDGDKFTVGKYEFHVIEVPGHTPGGVFYVCDNAKIVFSGDSLFKRSIGNTSFPGGDHEQLIKSLKRAVAMVPDDFKVYPGHDDTTTIGSEKKKNSYLQ